MSAMNLVDVGRAEAKFAGARPDLDAGGAVDLLELLGDFFHAVGGSVVNDDEFPRDCFRRRSC